MAMAAEGARNSDVDGYSEDAAPVLALRFDAIDGRAGSTAAAGAATAASRRGSEGAGVSVALRSLTMDCFLSVFSFFASARTARARVRSSCQEDHRCDQPAAKRKRAFRNAVALVNENFVDRKSDMRNADSNNTSAPVLLNDDWRASADILPIRPPGRI